MFEYVKYSLGLKEFAFSHQQYGLDVSLHHLTWKEHFTSNTEMKGWESHPFFENLWLKPEKEPSTAENIPFKNKDRQPAVWKTEQLADFPVSRTTKAAQDRSETPEVRPGYCLTQTVSRTSVTNPKYRVVSV